MAREGARRSYAINNVCRTNRLTRRALRRREEEREHEGRRMAGWLAGWTRWEDKGMGRADGQVRSGQLRLT